MNNELRGMARRILELIQDADKPVTPREINATLNLRGKQKKRLQVHLNTLVKAREIVALPHGRFAIGEGEELITGRLSVLKSGNAFVNSEAAEEGIFVAEKDLGTSLPGDEVIVRLYPAHAAGGAEPKRGPSGRVVKVSTRGRRDVVGILRSSGRFLYVVPITADYRRDFLVQDAHGAKLGDRVVARIEGWENKHVMPHAEIIENLGPMEQASADTVAILKHYDLPDAFPDEVIHEAEEAAALMDAPGEREDLSDLLIITIDPDTSRDFDDALSVTLDDQNRRVLGVHIADVSHFVKVGSALDEEAAKRGNSCYFPDRVIPMLPEQLSNGICSLHPDIPRLAVSVFMTVDAAGKVVDTRASKSRIISKARLTYGEALDVLMRRKSDLSTDVKELLLELRTIAEGFRAARTAAGALQLEMSECEIKTDLQGNVVDIEMVSSDPAHQLVEECMVAANEVVARELFQRKVRSIARLHEKPNPTKLDDLRATLESMGLAPGDLSKKGVMTKFLAEAVKHPLSRSIQIAVLKSMNRALYSSLDTGHYGLSKTYYTHFTSPIRRYTDLVIHRQLAELLGATGGARYESGQLGSIARHCTDTEYAAEMAERQVVEIKKYRWLESLLAQEEPRTFDAIVVAVVNFGFFVELPLLQLQGLVHSATLKGGKPIVNLPSQTLRVGKRTYRSGDPLTVALTRVDIDARKLDFVVVD
jgi:ribonuclease R